MKIVVSHPTANANTREVVEGLNKNKSLKNFYTSVVVFPNSFLYRLGKLSYFKELHRRVFPITWKNATKSNPWKELVRVIASRFGWYKLIKHESGYFSVDKIYEFHDNWVAKNLHKEQKKGLDTVYAFDGGAYNTFLEAKKLAIRCIYDLPTGYWRAARILLQEELTNNPNWASTMIGFKDSQEKLNKKDMELALADKIFVASSFTRETLKYYPEKLSNIIIIPYGFPDVKSFKKYNPLQGRKLKILFVGNLSQAKGISYLFDAFNELKDFADLTIVGKKTVHNCEILNLELNKHNWINGLPHHEVLECMSSHDVLVFPSLFEGFGLVISEAMSQGTPVITTNRTAGSDLIENGVDGWIVEASSSNAIKAVLEYIIKNPLELEKVGTAAQQKAQTRPWSVYGSEIVKALNN